MKVSKTEEGILCVCMNVMSYSHVLLVCRKDAENAMNMLNATVIGKQTVRLSWGRSQGNKQVISGRPCHVIFPLPV